MKKDINLTKILSKIYLKFRYTKEKAKRKKESLKSHFAGKL